jgi:hypothetical protein
MTLRHGMSLCTQVVVGVGYVAPARRRAKRQAAESLRVNTSRHYLSLRDIAPPLRAIGRRAFSKTALVFIFCLHATDSQSERPGDEAG